MINDGKESLDFLRTLPHARRTKLRQRLSKSESMNQIPNSNMIPELTPPVVQVIPDDMFESVNMYDGIQSRPIQPILKSPLQIEQELNIQDGTEKYVKYIVPKNSRAPPTCMPIQIAIKELETMSKKINSELIYDADRVQKAISNQRDLSIKLMKVKYYDLKEIRDGLKYYLAALEFEQEFYDDQMTLCQNKIGTLMDFNVFLQNQNDNLLADLGMFLVDCFPNSKTSPAVFQTKLDKLKRRNQKVSLPKVSTTDPILAFIHPTTRTGKIVQRFILQINQLLYPDLEVIVDAVSDDSNRSQIMDLFFDIAWTVKDYPLTPLNPKLSDPLPNIYHLMPKVFNPPLIDDEYAYIPFSELSLRDWPLKPSVNMIFLMMVETNPIKIAQIFWQIIESIGDNLRKVHVARGKNADDFDLDFDQIFILMLVCLFTAGIPEITQAMTYSFSFREFVNDPQVQYAMSHLEGLFTHLLSLNVKELNAKNEELLKQKGLK